MVDRCVERLGALRGGAEGGAGGPWTVYCSLNIPHPPFQTNATWLQVRQRGGGTPSLGICRVLSVFSRGFSGPWWGGGDRRVEGGARGVVVGGDGGGVVVVVVWGAVGGPGGGGGAALARPKRLPPL
jgi:hypothetical protein